MSSTIVKSFEIQFNTIDLFYLLKDEPNFFCLDSSLAHREYGRYSILGYDPFEIFQGNTKEDFQQLKEKFNEYKFEEQASLPISSGLVGFLSYDFGYQLLDVDSSKIEFDQTPGFFFGFYDRMIIIDHHTKQMHIVSTGLPEKGKDQRKRAEARLNEAITKLKPLTHRAVHPWPNTKSKNVEVDCQLSLNMSRDEYIQMIRRALEHIEQGDIYQVNLAQQFKMKLKQWPDHIHPINIYRTLRALSPTSFGAYYNAGEFQILSSSPERFLKLNNDISQIRPMKGTRQRGKTTEEDSKFKEELLQSPKENAELLMITDLERNDLGRVCEYGSVNVVHMRTLEEYSTVFQATSTVEGKLDKDKDCFDLLTACFPGGSVTGCPKLRSMEIIDQLEKTNRGLYTGSLGYIGFDGNVDFNILIRTLLVTKDSISFHVGGGIVADSDPEVEYDETLIKAKAMMHCLESVFQQKLKQSIETFM